MAGYGRAYPLLVSQETDEAVTRLRADRGYSLGRAYNVLIREGLYSLGYLTRPPTTEEELMAKKAKDLAFVNKHWTEMDQKAKQYWVRKLPELGPMLQVETRK